MASLDIPRQTADFGNHRGFENVSQPVLQAPQCTIWFCADETHTLGPNRHQRTYLLQSSPIIMSRANRRKRPPVSDSVSIWGSSLEAFTYSSTPFPSNRLRMDREHVLSNRDRSLGRHEGFVIALRKTLVRTIVDNAESNP
jgi:hypothetical protein